MSFRISEIEPSVSGRPINPEFQNKYTVPVNEVDVYSMLVATKIRLEKNLAEDRDNFKDPHYWGEEFPNLKEVDFNKYFEALTGAIKLPDDLSDPAIDSFFSKPHRGYKHGRHIENRGKSYYVAVDPDFITSKDKFVVIKDDYRDGLEVLYSFDRSRSSVTETIGFIGVLDYLKQHTLTALHVLTYPERLGEFNADKDYSKNRQQAERLARLFTRTYYQAILGQRFDNLPNQKSLINNFELLVEYLLTQDRNYKQFTVQEVDHPLRIMSHIHKVIESGDRFDTLLALMSGGTQTAIAMGLGIELRYRKVIPIVFIPLSLHSAKNNFDKSFTSDQLKRCLKPNEDFIRGKNISVVEDNANTGQTVQLTCDTLQQIGASSVSASFVEIDPYRVIYKQSPKRDNHPQNVANFMHPDFAYSIGTLPIARLIKQDYQLRKLYIWRLFNSYGARPSYPKL